MTTKPVKATKDTNEKISKALGVVMRGIIDSYTKHRAKDPKYTKLFDASKHGIGHLMMECCHQQSTSILDAVDLLEQKTGKRITPEIYQFFQALPLLERISDRSITELEGSACSHDKTIYLLEQMLEELIDRAPAVTGGTPCPKK